jgi:hypothetical protein
MININIDIIFTLFYFILISFVLFYFNLFYFVLFYFILFYLIRKYDTSSNIDRSEVSTFPDAYVTALSARTVAVCKGKRAFERDIKGKLNGAKTPFIPVRRPKILDLR